MPQVVDDEAGALGEDPVAVQVLAYEVRGRTFLFSSILQLDSFVRARRHRL